MQLGCFKRLEENLGPAIELRETLRQIHSSRAYSDIVCRLYDFLRSPGMPEARQLVARGKITDVLIEVRRRLKLRKKELKRLEWLTQIERLQ